MMEFLTEYSMFLLKTFTFVLGFLALIAGMSAIGHKRKPKLEILSLNEEFDHIKQQMEQKILGKASKKKNNKKEKKPSLYVLDFCGDMKASQVEQLRQEITAILSLATPQDEVLLRLESPGGSVNGYGLAAAQLQRLRDRQIPMTISIDKIAASGGYLMACVANKIIAAPFAIVGSIGVVAQLPNFHRWLKKNDIDVELLTAGEYKRTLTIFGENTEKDREKFQDDLDKIHLAFRDYLLHHRQQLDLTKVATGEFWLAKDAIALQLVDTLQTSDDFLTHKMSSHHAYKVKVNEKQPLIARLMKPMAKLLHPWA